MALQVSGFLFTNSFAFRTALHDDEAEVEAEQRPGASITALPSVPESEVTALPDASPSTSNRVSWVEYQPRRSWLDTDGLWDYDANPPRGWRQNVLYYASTLYGKEPADPVSMEIPNEPTISPPTGFRLILLLLSGALPYVVAVIDDTIIATIIPVLVNEFKKPAEIGWYASAYFLPLTVFMPIVGKCYSLWKIKWIFFGSLLILLVGSIVCATARTSSAFIAGRVISGTGAAGIINGAMRIIGVSSDRNARTFLEATGALFMGVCTVTGPILGGVISTHAGWRVAFWINVPIAVVSLVVIAVIFPAEAHQASLAGLPFRSKLARLDPIGAMSLVIGLICLITLLQKVSTSITFSGGDGVLAVMACIFLVGFAVHECFIRPDLALIPRHIIRHRAVWSCCTSLFLLFAGWMNFVFFLSIFFQTVLGQTAEQSALNLLPYVVAVSLAAAITGVTVSFLRYYNPLFKLGSILFAIGAGLTITFNETTTLGVRIAYEGIMGVGVGFLMLANVSPCQTFLDEKDHAVANGLTFFSSLLGATISLPISNTLFNRTLLKKIIAIDLTPGAKVLILLDPTRIREVTPAAQLDNVIQALVESVRTTFILGLCFAVMCAMCFYFVPWKELLWAEKLASALPSALQSARQSMIIEDTIVASTTQSEKRSTLNSRTDRKPIQKPPRIRTTTPVPRYVKRRLPNSIEDGGKNKDFDP